MRALGQHVWEALGEHGRLELQDAVQHPDDAEAELELATRIERGDAGGVSGPAGGLSAAGREARRKASVLGIEGLGWDIGHAVRFLLSAQARYITGQTLVVDGGALVARGTEASKQALESAARLVALAVERERFIEENAHIHALRESEALKTSLLRAISHDLTTPITAITIRTESVRRRAAGDPELLNDIGAIAEQRL